MATNNQSGTIEINNPNTSPQNRQAQNQPNHSAAPNFDASANPQTPPPVDQGQPQPVNPQPQQNLGQNGVPQPVQAQNPNLQPQPIEVSNIDGAQLSVHPPAQDLKDVRKDAQRIIYKTTSFSLLHPTTIIIDTEKVNIVQSRWRLFYKSFPIQISDIKTVVVGTGLIFGEVMLEITGYEKNPDTVKKLWSEEAVKAKRLLLGLIVAKKRNVDINKYGDEELLRELEEIGKSHSE